MCWEPQTDLMKKGLRPLDRCVDVTLEEPQTDLMKKGLRLRGGDAPSPDSGTTD